MYVKSIESVIYKMHLELNSIIKKNNFNLQSSEVQEYSRKLDRILETYMRKKNSIRENKRGR